jgi:hypothetical protein
MRLGTVFKIYIAEQFTARKLAAFTTQLSSLLQLFGFGYKQRKGMDWTFAL